MSWRCTPRHTALALVPTAIAGGACICAGWPCTAVRLSKAAVVCAGHGLLWAVLNLLTSMVCFAAEGAADVASALAMATAAVVAAAMQIQDQQYHGLAQAVLRWPVFAGVLNHVRNHGFLADAVLLNGWNRPDLVALVNAAVVVLASMLLHLQPTAAVLQAWLASVWPAAGGPPAAAS
ncbi:hypothetical protein C2E21_6238 [Chlorella sorokiniana]|uniref:Uncharacterized protein n=1 Tax=Chlorella sorokiniana TaxID=3076 RepID=A0A2P6TLL9_CHLSO|nr:hypothetical protein C2E21_6238 [Chlorella sorokiniana]|eukprot:PRW45182.1 hypothetical protein C2E21_6238 [Chlorella sorokiniana]